MTSNTGLLYLFIGQLLLVPIIQFVLNTNGRFWLNDKTSTFDFLNLAKWGLSLATTLSLNFAPFKFDNVASAWDSILRSVLTPILLTVQLFVLNKFPHTPVDSKNCSLIPRVDLDTSPVFSSPTSWTAQIVFFCSFILHNAIGIYNEPTPELSNVPEDQKANRQAKLDERVRNRKWISGTIIFISLLVLVGLLFFRYAYTPCESGFMRSLPGLLILFMSGASWFQFIYTYCGVRPADVLGIVQGLINPDLIDNPIVCIGT
jgi:hypothetical protein